MKNTHPISNLPFISKCIEKIVACLIEEHLEHNDLHDNYQSGCLWGHSTETALLKEHWDDTDEGSMSVLIMLDLSAIYSAV